MAFDPSGLQAVIFDYGNTLVRFSPDEIRRMDDAVMAVLEDALGPVDHERYHELRIADRHSIYREGFPENVLSDVFTRHVQALFGHPPSPDLLQAMLRTRFDVVVEMIERPPYLHDLLERLGDRYRLGVLSNYPDGEAVRASLRRLDLFTHFDAVVVSADLGHVKPHPVLFETVLDRLLAEPETALHVGDNWFADVQGAKRAGLRACHVRQWEFAPQPDPAPGDAEPDLTVGHLTELADVLL